MWYVYILSCSDGSFYTGITNNVAKRFKDHLSGRGAKYTKSHKPEKVVYREEFSSKSEALKREAELKKWPRAKKDVLIRSRFSTTKKTPIE
ncbi:MAG: GIY-YIG nuclease family protein [Candidatus Microgenomates bacterium]